jgi:two-component system phosphate regulon sensor histidine kinase PhoR
MKHLNLNLKLTSVMILIAAGVLLPVLLATATGIITLVIARDAGGIITGVLVISFAVTALGSALVTVVLTGRKARLARLQADFIANVSHEFRTPLSAIRLYTQTLQREQTCSDEKQRAECLATILRETNRLDMMIERVLTWRGASKDMMPLNPVVAPITATIRDALDRFKSMTPPETVTLTTELSSRSRVFHDPESIHSAVLNLLTNAYKYTGDDKRIHVTVKDHDQNVLITVRDNGIGMSPSQMKRIFQPFYRATDSDVHTSGGVGLGLAIANYQIKQHHGSLTVQSEKGRGSCFTITLPVTTETR